MVLARLGALNEIDQQISGQVARMNLCSALVIASLLDHCSLQTFGEKKALRTRDHVQTDLDYQTKVCPS